MIRFSLVVLLGLAIGSHAQDQLLLSGLIGKYPVEMIISSSDYESGKIEGKYRYASKEKFLGLKGQISDGVIFFEEFYKGEVSGTFYLEVFADSLTGYWTAGSKSYRVALVIGEGNYKMLMCKSLEDYQNECNKEVNGSYCIESYYINDWFYTPDKPELYVGFSGGCAIVEQIHKDSIRFEVEVVCGPTYHVAYAEGVAHKKGDAFIFDATYDDEGEKCIITINITEKGVTMVASKSFECGFGARAYLDHEFRKTSDEFKFGEEGQSLDKIKGLED